MRGRPITDAGMIGFFLAISSFAFCIFAVAPTAKPEPQIPARPGSTFYQGGYSSSYQGGAPTSCGHKVRPGETLYSIATKYGTTAAALGRKNGLRDLNRIRVGQCLTTH